METNYPLDRVVVAEFGMMESADRTRSEAAVYALVESVWRSIRGPLQWYVLWLAHSKFIVGVSGVVLNDEKNLLLLRHRYWREGSWGLPSGYAQRGECLEDALAREVFEETGYQIRVGPLLNITSGYQLRLEMSYVGYIVEGDLRLDAREVLEARFFSAELLPAGLLESHREIISLAFPSRTVKNRGQ